MEAKKRLIDANDAYKYAKGQYRDGRFTDEEYDAVLQTLDDADTVDAVEVVRCKDCKKKIEYGFMWCSKTDVQVQEDDFCSYGERKEEG